MSRFRLAPLVASALCLAALAAPAAADSLGAARSVAIDNVLKSECSKFYRVNPGEIAAMNFMLREAFGKDDPGFEAKVGTETASLRNSMSAIGAKEWCLDQKARLQAVGARKMFQ